MLQEGEEEFISMYWKRIKYLLAKKNLVKKRGKPLVYTS